MSPLKVSVRFPAAEVRNRHHALAIEHARLFAELNRSYQDLQQAQDELIRSAKLQALGQMAAGIAHDLNNMLAAILGHPPEVREALTNLILNAVDAMPQGGTLALRGLHVEREAGTPGDPGWVELSVTDTGIGMPERIRQRIFDPFFTTKGARGTGLGLSVVYGILERHGGHIAVTSAPDKGTTVTLRFLAALADAVAPAPAPALPVVARRLLLIDDDIVVRQTLASLLRSAGHTVLEADGGAAGLAALADQSVDLVCTDLGMPGWDVDRAVKTRTPSLPVILLTGWGEHPVGEGSEGPFADRVLGKPVCLKELLDTIADLTTKQPPSQRAP